MAVFVFSILTEINFIRKVFGALKVFKLKARLNHLNSVNLHAIIQDEFVIKSVISNDKAINFSYQ